MGGEFSASMSGVRAGARVLPLAANPIKRGILREMLDRPLRMGPGRRYQITSSGRGMLYVAFVVEQWLMSSPQGPLDFDSREAESAVAALTDGWSATVMHALAREPSTLPDLDRTIDGLNRRALKRRLEAMQRADLVEARPSDGEGAIYAVTDWLRAGIAPLAASARLERRAPAEDMAPIAALDVEAAFLLTLPLLELPADVSGSCRLCVEMDEGQEQSVAGATARIEDGRVVSCTVSLEDEIDAWASSSAGKWLETVIEPDAKSVTTGGDRYLASVLLNGLHKTLFGIAVQ